MDGPSVKSLRLIEKLCGESNFKAISIATTMWESVDSELANKREQSLISTPGFFGALYEGGATVGRHLNTPDSAVHVVEAMLRKQLTVVWISSERWYKSVNRLESPLLANTSATTSILYNRDMRKSWKN
jgi:hypothetical protein